MRFLLITLLIFVKVCLLHSIDMKARADRLMNWLSSNGGFVNPNLEVDFSPEYGYGYDDKMR